MAMKPLYQRIKPVSIFQSKRKEKKKNARSRLRVKVGDSVHRGDLSIVELLRLGVTTLDDDVAEDEGETDATVDGLLRLLEAGLDELALGGEPVTCRVRSISKRKRTSERR
jgi:hypothetical protein